MSVQLDTPAPLDAFSLSLGAHPSLGGRAQKALDLPVLVDVVRGFAQRPNLWEHHIQYNSHRRWWTQLVADKNIDVWLLTWLTTQETELHDHGGSSAAFTVVQGALSEVRVGAHGAVELSKVDAASHTVQWVAPGTVHDVGNPFAQPAVSIHAYSPPLTQMTYYEREPNGLRAIRTEPVHGPERI